MYPLRSRCPTRCDAGLVAHVAAAEDDAETLCVATNVAAEETRSACAATRARRGAAGSAPGICSARRAPRARRIFSLIGATVRFGAPEVSGVARTVGDANVDVCGIVCFSCLFVSSDVAIDVLEVPAKKRARDESDA